MGKLREINDRFNKELDQLLAGKLEKGHVFKLGRPGKILRKTGFPAEQEIELSARRLDEKSMAGHHPFSSTDLKDLVKAINEPVAVFAYGDKNKAQNVIVEIQTNNRNFLVGIHFDQDLQGVSVSSIRTLFPKDNHEWLNWINQGKLLYANIKKLQAVVTQQQTNPADVGYLNLEHIENIIQENKNVKHYFTAKTY